MTKVEKNDSQTVTAQVRRSITNCLGDRSALVGLSGGCDSVLLAFMAVRALGKERVRAVHVHHGLCGEADSWVQHCEALCQWLEIPLLTRHVNLSVAAPGSGVEEKARIARYQVFRDVLQEQDVLLLAHHRNDQVENFFIRMLRGAGLDGLAGWKMEDVGMFDLPVVRPFLELERARLERLASDLGLDWVDDPSNRNARFERNFVRAKVLPLLIQRKPDGLAVMARNQALLREARDLLRDVAAEDWDKLAGHQWDYLPMEAVTALSGSRLRNLLRFWVARRGMRPPSQKVLARVATELVNARQDRNPEVTWPDGSFRRFRQRIYLLAPLPEHTAEPLTLGVGDEVIFSGIPFWARPVTPAQRGSGDHDGEAGHDQMLEKRLVIPVPENDCLTLKPLAPGATWLKGGMHREIREGWREKGVPPWLRERLPGVYCRDELLAVPYLGVSDVAGRYLSDAESDTAHFSPTAGPKKYLVEWFPPFASL